MSRAYYLAFDIETSGIDTEILGIGVCVVRDDGEEIERKRFGAFAPGETVFEAKCLDEVWIPLVNKSKYKTLNEFMVKTFGCTTEIDEMENKRLKSDNYPIYPTSDYYTCLMLDQFFTFIMKWQKKELDSKNSEEEITLYICSDNPGFDMGIINEVGRKVRFFPNKKYKEIPFNQITKEWNPIIDVDSFARGVIGLIDWEQKIKIFGIGKRLNEIYTELRNARTTIISRRETNEHFPEDDAYNIAYDMMLSRHVSFLFNIKARKI